MSLGALKALGCIGVAPLWISAMLLPVERALGAH